MKKNNYITLMALLAVLFACETEYEPLNDFSDVDWYTSGFRYEKMVTVEDYMSFSDLSQGTLEHAWSFSDTSGCKFLTGNISRQDSAYLDFIDETLENVSTEKTVSVLFTEPGLHGIRLRNTFPEFVEFKGADTLAAKLEGDVWVIDTTFTVDVYDTIQSAFKVYHNDVEIASVAYDQQSAYADKESWPTYEIQAAESLTFVDLTEKGRPDSRTWASAGSAPGASSDSVATMYFYQLGTFNMKHTSSRTGENIPGGNKLKFVPLNIVVTKSLLPFEVTGQIVETKSELIQISVTGEVESVVGQEENFTVKVTNANGFDETIGVKSVGSNTANETIIELELEAPIYNSDNITVSYVGNTIASKDERVLSSFTDLPVVMYAPELFDQTIYGFEGSHDSWMAIEQGNVEITDEKAASGSYSLKLESEAGDVWTAAEMISESGKVTLTPGVTYVFSWKLWRDPSEGQNNTLGPWLKWDTGQKQFWTGLGGLPQGEWTTITKEFVYTGSGATWAWFRIRDKNLVYIDDVSIKVSESRPAL